MKKPSSPTLLPLSPAGEGESPVINSPSVGLLDDALWPVTDNQSADPSNIQPFQAPDPLEGLLPVVPTGFRLSLKAGAYFRPFRLAIEPATEILVQVDAGNPRRFPAVHSGYRSTDVRSDATCPSSYNGLPVLPNPSHAHDHIFLPQGISRSAGKKKTRQRRFKSIVYCHFIEDWQHIPRDTAVIGNQVIYSYPHIGRVLALEVGLKAQFQAPFWAEEKINGFNVCILRFEAMTLALSRGGFVCPFTTNRLPDLMPLQVIDDHPENVVCAEVAGPDNPYLESCPPFVKEDIQLFVFDLMEKNHCHFLPYREKMVIVDGMALPS